MDRYTHLWLLRFFLLLLFPVVALAAGPHGKYYGARPTEYPVWFKSSFLNLQEDVAEAKGAGKRLMLVFYQDSCPYCNLLVERNFSQRDIEATTRRHFDSVGINLWGDREVVGLDGRLMTEKDLAAALKVQFTPTILFFDERGDTILRLNGYLPPPRFKAALEYVAKRKERVISYRDYIAAAAPVAAAGKMHHQDFFLAEPYDLSRASERPFAVFFEHPDCPACDTLHTRVLTDPETRRQIGKFDVVQLDMWSGTPVKTRDGQTVTARDWARVLDVKYAPTLIVFNEQGREIIRSEAFFKVFHTQGLFHYVSSKGYQNEPSFQRYLSAHAEKLRAQGKDVDIWRMADEPVGVRKK